MDFPDLLGGQILAIIILWSTSGLAILPLPVDPLTGIACDCHRQKHDQKQDLAITALVTECKQKLNNYHCDDFAKTISSPDQAEVLETCTEESLCPGDTGWKKEVAKGCYQGGAKFFHDFDEEMKQMLKSARNSLASDKTCNESIKNKELLYYLHNESLKYLRQNEDQVEVATVSRLVQSPLSDTNLKILTCGEINLKIEENQERKIQQLTQELANADLFPNRALDPQLVAFKEWQLQHQPVVWDGRAWAKEMVTQFQCYNRQAKTAMICYGGVLAAWLILTPARMYGYGLIGKLLIRTGQMVGEASSGFTLALRLTFSNAAKKTAESVLGRALTAPEASEIATAVEEGKSLADPKELLRFPDFDAKKLARYFSGEAN